MKKLILAKICFGATSDPHYSSYVPGNINGMSETSCLGKQVSVDTSLYLGSLELKHNFITNGFTSHKDHAVLSTSMRCQLGHTYVVAAISFHVDNASHGAETVNRATVYCGKIVAPKAAPPVKAKK